MRHCTMQYRMKMKKGYMMLKLNTSKAYGIVELNFLEAVMKKTGFADKCMTLIMACIKSVSYSILING